MKGKKKQTDKSVFINIYNFCSSIDTMKKMTSQATEQQNIPRTYTWQRTYIQNTLKIPTNQ